MPRHWMIYSHDALGLGHVRRSLAIARAVLSERRDVAALLVTCSPLIDSLPLAQGLDYVKLPSARKLGNGWYGPRTLPVAPWLLQSLRSTLLHGVAREFEPELLLADKSPAGLLGELARTLDLLSARRPQPRLVLGLRDILDEPAAVAREWDSSGAFELIQRHYDEIWVYGDAEVFDVRRAYALPERLAERVRYLGYLVPSVLESARRTARQRLGVGSDPFALVTVGGGEDGERVIATYLEAVDRGLLPADLRSVVVLGPLMPMAGQRAMRAAAQRGVVVEEFLPNLAPAIAAADVVIGMAGYNTVCEMLGGGTPAVLVPRTHPRREQLVRARCLEHRGLAACIEPGRLDPPTLAQGVRTALKRGRVREALPALDGLEQVTRHVERLLPQAGIAKGVPKPLGSPVVPPRIGP